jgi:hypothetical protein
LNLTVNATIADVWNPYLLVAVTFTKIGELLGVTLADLTVVGEDKVNTPELSPIPTRSQLKSYDEAGEMTAKLNFILKNKRQKRLQL